MEDSSSRTKSAGVGGEDAHTASAGQDAHPGNIKSSPNSSVKQQVIPSESRRRREKKLLHEWDACGTHPCTRPPVPSLEGGGGGGESVLV